VREYLAHRCLGQTIDLDNPDVRSRLQSFDIRKAVVDYLAKEIGELALEHKPIVINGPSRSLSSTKPFTWRRKHRRCEHTVFNYVAVFNDFEKRFAEFADAAPDVVRFAALGTTEQDSGVPFRIDYMKLSGARGFYHPDWIVVQKTSEGEVNWIVETKGRVWPGTENKDAAVTEWCRAVSEQTGDDWQYIRVNQTLFDSAKPHDFCGLLDAIQGNPLGLDED